MSEGATKIIITEDDTVVSKNLTMELQDRNYEVVGVPESAEELLAVLSKCIPDVIIMDINLAGVIDGIEVTSLIKSKFNVSIIYLTSDRDMATLDRAKLTNPDGYLIKPFDVDELVSTVELAVHRNNMASEEPNQTVFKESHIFIKVKNRLEKVSFHDIQYVEANDIYSNLHTDGKNYVLSYSLKNLQDKFQDPSFIRVHRSFIVNIKHINAIEDNFIIMKERQIPIGKTYRDLLMDRLDIL